MCGIFGYRVIDGDLQQLAVGMPLAVNVMRHRGPDDPARYIGLGYRRLSIWQMTGNVFRAVSWVFGYVLIARSAPFSMVLSQVASTHYFVAIAAYLIPPNHGVGLTQAYAACRRHRPACR